MVAANQIFDLVKLSIFAGRETAKKIALNAICENW